MASKAESGSKNTGKEKVEEDSLSLSKEKDSKNTGKEKVEEDSSSLSKEKDSKNEVESSSQECAPKYFKVSINRLKELFKNNEEASTWIDFFCNNLGKGKSTNFKQWICYDCVIRYNNIDSLMTHINQDHKDDEFKTARDYLDEFGQFFYPTLSTNILDSCWKTFGSTDSEKETLLEEIRDLLKNLLGKKLLHVLHLSKMLDYDVGQYTDVAMLFRTLETSKLENVRNLLKTLGNQCEVQLESTPSPFKSDVKVLDSYPDMKLAFDEEGSNILISADNWYKSGEFDFVAFESWLLMTRESSLLGEDAIESFSMRFTDIVEKYMEKCKKLKVLYDLKNHLRSYQSDLGYFTNKALEIYNLGEDIEDIDKTVAKGNKLVAGEVLKWSKTFTNSELMRVLPEEKKNADMELYLMAAKARMLLKKP